MVKRSAPPAPSPTFSAPPSTEPARQLQAALGPDYELGELLGKGGFAEVYVAWDRRLKREVAVKTIRAELVSSDAVLERFRREAEAIAQLRHPHVIPVYSVDERDGIAYFTMPRIRGESLAAALQRDERWSFSEVVRILREAAGALAEAHRNGIVHRDVKPENIMLDGPERRVVVMDFGIAKSVDEVAGGLTGTGILVGTPYYMSPEQASGDKGIDHLSDQYSLGIVGYRMLTGRLPFDAESTRAVLFQQAAVTVTPVRELRPDIPAALARVIERSLQKEPGLRFRSMDEFADALASVASEVAGEFRTGRRSPGMSDRWANVRLEIGSRARYLVATAIVAFVVFVLAFVKAEMGVVREFLGSRDETTFAARAYLISRGAPPGLAYVREAYADARLFSFLQAAVGRDSLEARIRAGEPLLELFVAGSGPDEVYWWANASFGQRITVWSHSLPDSVRRPNVSPDSARAVAEGEFRRQGMDAAQLTFLRRSETERRNRTDRTFTWEAPAQRVVHGSDTARAEVVVTVAGGEARFFRRIMTLTQGFQPGLSQRNRSFLFTVSLIALVAVAIAAALNAIRRSSRDTLQWTPALRWGVVGPLLLLVSYTIPYMVRSVMADPDVQVGLTNAISTFFGDVPDLASTWILSTFAFIAAESLTYEKRPDLMFGMTEWSRGRFAIPETIPAALFGYAAGFVGLAGGYIVLAVARNLLGAPFDARPFNWFVFNSLMPSLAVPYTATIAIGLTITLAFFVAFAVQRGSNVAVAVVLFGCVSGLFRLGNTTTNELRTLVEAALFIGAGWLFYRRGALATLVALFVVAGTPVAVDFFWAGGPYTSAGVASVAFLLLPAVLAMVAYKRRPGAAVG